MSLLKWSMILFYWLWLAIRNAHSKQRDWRLAVQILINVAVILLIIMEDRAMFVQMLGRLADFTGWLSVRLRG